MREPLLGCLARAAISWCLTIAALAAQEEVVPKGEVKRPVLRILNWSAFIDLAPDAPDPVACPVHGEQGPPPTPGQEPGPPVPRTIVQQSRTLREFAAQFDCDIVYTEYETPETALKAIEYGSQSVDLLITSDEVYESLMAGGRVAPLRRELVPHLSNLEARYRTGRSLPRSRYAVPYLVGTVGIVSRTDLVPPIDSYHELLVKHRVDLLGKVSLMDDAVVVVGAGLVTLGHDPTTEDPLALREAHRLLWTARRRGTIARISGSVEATSAALLSGELAASVMYSGEGIGLARSAPSLLRFVLPSEGGLIFVDSMMVPVGAAEPELAHSFINYILRPEVHARLAESLHYMCPNAAALPLTGDAHRLDPAIYPPPGVALKLREYGACGLRERMRILERLRG